MTKIKITIVFLVYLAMIFTVLGAHTYWSNIVTDQVTEYSITLSKDSAGGALYTNVTLSVLVKLGSAPVNGATVQFYKSLDNSTWTLLGSNTTNLLGNAYWTANRTEIGTIYYKGSYDAS